MEVLVFLVLFIWFIGVIRFFASLASDSKHAREKAEAARKSNARVASVPSYISGATLEDRQKSAGDHGEALVAMELERLKMAGIIQDYIQTENMAVNGSRFEVDFVVYTQDKGLMLLETKYWAGTLTVKPEGDWIQTKEGYPPKALKNPAQQVMRQKRMLSSAIAKTGLPTPTMTPAVVLAHAQCRLKLDHTPTVDLLHATSLPTWLYAQPYAQVNMTRHQWAMLKGLMTELEKDAVELEKTLNLMPARGV